MRLMLISASTVLGLALGACGSKSDADQQDLVKFDSETESAVAEEFANLPENVLIKVELDSAGNEISESARMVTVNGEVTEETYADALANGTPVTDFIDGDNDLDDSSTASWFGWRRNSANNNQSFNGQRGLININIGGSFSQQTAQSGAVGRSSAYSSSRFNSYRPAYRSKVYSRGYYSYSRPTCFQRPTYRVYQYSRTCVGYSYCQGFSSSRGYGASW